MMQQTARSGEKAPLFDGRKPLFTQSQLLKLTWPLLVEQFLAVTVGMADTMMVSRCGEAAISGVSLVDMINNLIIVLFSALATGGAVVVSQFLGAREQKSANKSAGQLILLSGILGLGVGVLCFVLARPMIRLFYGSIDADVLDAGTLYLKIIAVSYPFLALYNAGAALFRSMGNSRISMQISVLMNIINIVGNAVCIFGLKMGVDGVAWPSVVSRVSGMFTRRGFNIDTLTVGETESPEFSRITISMHDDEAICNQIVKQLEKMYDVKKVQVMQRDETVARELLLIKIKNNAAERQDIMSVVDVFRAKITDYSPEALVIEIRGVSTKINAFIELLEPYGILEMCRTGLVALERGGNCLKNA